MMKFQQTKAKTTYKLAILNCDRTEKGMNTLAEPVILGSLFPHWKMFSRWIFHFFFFFVTSNKCKRKTFKSLTQRHEWANSPTRPLCVEKVSKTYRIFPNWNLLNLKKWTAKAERLSLWTPGNLSPNKQSRVFVQC